MKKQVFTILADTPVNILEEDDTFLEVHKWELFSPRKDGSRNIGAFNLMVAIKVIAEAENTTVDNPAILEQLESICNSLVDSRFLRLSPEFRRNQLKLVEEYISE